MGSHLKMRCALQSGRSGSSRSLETVVLIFESGEWMVIHAMPARKQYWTLLG